jgi:hypothetical protein
MGDLVAGLGKEAARELSEKVQRGKVIMAAMHVGEIGSRVAAVAGQGALVKMDGGQGIP